MRLAIVVNRFPTLSETFIFNKVVGLRRLGIDVTVHIYERQNHLSYYRKQLENKETEFVVTALMAWGSILFAPRLLFFVIRYPNASVKLLWQAIHLYGFNSRAFKAWQKSLPLAVRNYDLIHFELSGLAVQYLDALPLLASAKLLTSCRGAAEQIVPLVNRKRADELTQVFSSIDRVHCVSVDMVCTAMRYGLQSEKSFVNHPSIDVDQFQRNKKYIPKSTPPYRIVSVGRLHWKKGYQDALVALKKLLLDGYQVSYEIVGGGPVEDELRYIIDDLELNDHVFLKGPQSAQFIRDLLEEADIFWLPSLSEGLANSALEAMSMELPVVSTTAGGMNEAIIDGQEGFLVPPYTPDAIVEKTKMLLQNPDLRCAMGKAARHRVKQDFNLQRQVERFVEEYEKLLNVTSEPL